MKESEATTHSHTQPSVFSALANTIQTSDTHITINNTQALHSIVYIEVQILSTN